MMLFFKSIVIKLKRSLLYPGLLLSLILQASYIYAQNDHKTAVLGILSSVTRLTDNKAPEKIYLHTDKPFYTAGDTLWFKAYLFNAAYLTASQKSGIAYVEIADEQNAVVKRFMVSMYIGLGWGNIVLNEKEFPAGNYSLRAYTNWMRNFDEHYVFKKQFYISRPGENNLFFKSRFNVLEEAGKQRAEIGLQVNKTNQLPLLLGEFKLNVIEGNKVWYKDKVQTKFNGSFDFNFDIPQNANPNKLFITLQDLKKTEESPVYKIPVILNRPQNIDLQFMPEGGSLVAGIDAHIAFKSLAEDGYGVNVSGVIYNSKQQEVCTFNSAHLGMGSFDLHPQPNEIYTAKIKLPGGAYSKAYALPVVSSSGMGLKVINKLESDSLEIRITATSDLLNDIPVYYLVAQARGVDCYGSVIKLKSGTDKIKINKAAFPTGAARFTLFNTARQPLNERLVYIDNDDHLRLNVVANKSWYTKRDSVGLAIAVADKTGKPVTGSLSVAITDDAQIKNDSLKNNTLKSYILLTADLKGNVEEPSYYFPPVLTDAIWQRLDDLLLAQGWVNYDWGAVFQSYKPGPYPSETGFSIKGKVTNIFNKPVEKAGIIMLSEKPFFIRDTMTDKNGIFNFTNIYSSDTAVYVIQSRNKKGKSFNVGIDMEEFKPPVFPALTERIIPWYVNIDSSKIKTLNNYLAYKNEQEILARGHLLKEVKITDKKIIKDSKNLNGAGGSDFALNQEDMEKAGKTSLGDLLKKYYPSFRLDVIMKPPAPPIYAYKINFAFFHLIIDGIDIDFANPFPLYTYDHYMYVKHYLDYYKAEDIKGIEVMTSSQYGTRYTRLFLGPMAVQEAYVFVEVTTYAGTGPFLKNTPGVFLYRPLSFSSQKQFYSPKYTIKDDHSFVDTRSVIYWSPNVITDKDGKAKLFFYTADKPGTYTVLIDGCDMNGNIESVRKKIVVK